MDINAITLIGTSGVGKTTLSTCLQQDGWYHYSGDYRIATHYLYDAISDWLETLTAEHSELADLLSINALRIQPYITIENLRALSAFIGKLGQGALDYQTFCTRQQWFVAAEKAAIYDFIQFRDRACRRYGSSAFINDIGGSLCEYTDDQALMDYLYTHTLPVYIRADRELEAELLARAIRYPKPICYDPAFLDKMIAQFSQKYGISQADEFPADEFIRYVLPYMIEHRDQRAMRIVARGGIVLDAREVWQVRDAQDFKALVEAARHKQSLYS